MYIIIPARLSFSGGGTDFSKVINENKIYIISSTINKFINVELEIVKNNTQILFIDNIRLNLKKRKSFSKYKLIYKIMDFYNLDFGFNLKIISEFDRGSGLGPQLVLYCLSNR